jgi:hypothetical protein
VATEAAWLNGNNLKKETTKKRKKQTERLDTHRPSWKDLAIFRSVLSVTALAVIMRRACTGADLSSSSGESQS